MNLMPKSLSPSAMNSWRVCQYRWMCGKLDLPFNATERSREFYGKAIHNIAVLYYGELKKMSGNPSAKQIARIAKEAFEDGKQPVMSHYGARNKLILKNFIEFEQDRLKTWKQYKPTFTERMLQGKLFPDVPPFRCITDAYWKEDEIIVDWKSGKVEMNESLIIQGTINRLLAEAEGFPVKKVIFVGLWTGRTLTTPKTSPGWIHTIAREMVDMIAYNRYPKCETGLCPWCPFGLRCEFEGVKELWDGIQEEMLFGT